MAFDFLKVDKCGICGKQRRKIFLDKFKFLSVDGSEIIGLYCWGCSFRYDRYNFLLPGKHLFLGGTDEQKMGGK